MDKEATLPSYGPYHSQQHYQSCLLRFKVLTMMIQTAVVEDLIQEAERVSQSHSTRRIRQASSMSQIQRLDSRHNRHWLTQCRRIWCLVYSAKNKETRTKYKCRKCNIGSCAIPCFELYHTKLHCYEPAETKLEKQNTQL